MTGRIVKLLGGLYFVLSEGTTYECKPKGVFRKMNVKPLVGDFVTLELLPDGSGLILDVLERRSSLIRPEVANADHALLFFAAASPNPSLNLADRFLINMQAYKLPVTIAFNKVDLIETAEEKRLTEAFSGSGYQVKFLSLKENIGVEEVLETLRGHTTVMAGPSGVGKSSFVNRALGLNKCETGDISEKIGRGKNTTRHSELMRIDDESWIFDTPGFTSFDLTDIEAGDLQHYYPEMAEVFGECRFTGCVHINEPDCAVKNKLTQGKISPVRYENYKMLYEELKKRKKY